LELVYARALQGRQIAARSMQEMSRQTPLDDSRAAAWEAELTRLFPDVSAGDRLTGVRQPGAPTRVFHNGQLRGEWQDPDLSRLFFGIWLAPQTSEPDLRRQLLGPEAGS
ncbi:MAG: chalcone isomerase family protein, partial [Rubrivivax sp.]|nr:chalcone isomerase family protein [Rubrivivax sp.]